MHSDTYVDNIEEDPGGELDN